MKDIHIVAGAANALHIESALAAHHLENVEVITIVDDFAYGSLRQQDTPFSVLRNDYWNMLKKDFNHGNSLDDLEKVLALLNQYKTLDSAINIHFWMSNKANELLTYYFLLHYLKPLMSQLRVININGLPFLNDDLQMYYPNGFIDINHKGIVKALKLSRAITASEFEADADEWRFFQQHLGTVRILTGGKKIAIHEDTYYDATIIDLIRLHPNKKWTKLLPLVKPLCTDFDQIFLNSRLQQLVEQSVVKIENGNLCII
jgi:hypothetical protein